MGETLISPGASRHLLPARKGSELDQHCGRFGFAQSRLREAFCLPILYFSPSRSRTNPIVKDNLRVKGYVRYMDDFILFCDDKAVLKKWLNRIDDFLRRNLILALNPNATIIAPVSNGIPFLGFRIYPRLIRIKRENLRRSLRRFKSREIQYGHDRIEFEKLLQSAGSIIAHMSHADSMQIRRRLFY
ncbi:RNA-directed DNA polymerase [bacterium]|nr:RNA-directed DNA polymerase [candidate division CSSED10-310 bacterium]